MKKVLSYILYFLLSYILAFLFVQLYKITPQDFQFVVAFLGGIISFIIIILAGKSE